MKTILSLGVLISAFYFGVILTSCSKSSSSDPAAAALNIPNMTAAVSGTTAAAISQTTTRSYMMTPVSQQNTGVLFSGTGPSDPIVNSLFGMVQSFVSYAKSSDGFACMIEVLAANNVLKTDGTETIFSDDQNNSFKIKFAVTAAGSVLQNFKMFVCSTGGTSNDQYVSGTLSGSDMTFTMKFNVAGAIQGSMEMQGTLDGSTWSSKVLTMETDIGSGSPTIASKFQIAQSSDNMLIKGTLNPGTLSNAYQMYSKFSLLGNSPATYAMGAGSSKYSVGQASDLFKHWDISGSTTSVSTSVYATDVTSGTYFPASLTFGGAMVTGETWDCAVGSATEVKISTMSSQALTSIQSCMENQQ